MGIAVTVFRIDEFNRSLGLPQEPLPDPVAGEPDHYRPSRAEHGTGFVAMLPADGATGKEAVEREAGAAVVVDAAAVAANFQRMVRIADSTGIPLDTRSAALSLGVRKELDLGRFASADNTPTDSWKIKALSIIVRPLARRVLGKLADKGAAD